MSGGGRGPPGRLVDAAGLSLAIAATRWHAEVTDTLRQPGRGRRAGLRRCPTRWWSACPAPSSCPVVAAELARRHDAVACLGAVIRGGTPHFEYVCDAVTYGLSRVALDTGTPVGNGVLTCDDIKQAIDRSGAEDSAEDKGWDAVLAALETALLLRSLRQPAELRRGIARRGARPGRGRWRGGRRRRRAGAGGRRPSGR